MGPLILKLFSFIICVVFITGRQYANWGIRLRGMFVARSEGAREHPKSTATATATHSQSPTPSNKEIPLAIGIALKIVVHVSMYLTQC